MGLFSWFLHVHEQQKIPWHATCQRCGARLRPRGVGALPVIAAMLLCSGLGFAVATLLGLPMGPYNVGIMAVGLLGGTFASYPLARYRLADSESRGELPPAQVESDEP